MAEYTIISVSGWLSRYSDSLRAGQSEDRIPVEGGGGQIFRIRPDRPGGPPRLLYNRYRCFLGVKQPGRGVDHPPPHSAEVKERVELYFHSHYRSSWPVLGVNFYTIINLNKSFTKF